MLSVASWPATEKNHVFVFNFILVRCMRDINGFYILLQIDLCCNSVIPKHVNNWRNSLLSLQLK